MADKAFYSFGYWSHAFSGAFDGYLLLLCYKKIFDLCFQDTTKKTLMQNIQELLVGHHFQKKAQRSDQPQCPAGFPLLFLNFKIKTLQKMNGIQNKNCQICQGTCFLASSLRACSKSTSFLAFTNLGFFLTGSSSSSGMVCHRFEVRQVQHF